MNINEIKPILADSTFAQLNLGAFITAVRFSSIMILFIFSFHMSDKVHVIKVFGVILGVFIISFLLILLPTILVLGYVYARHLLSPYFIFVVQVEAFDFLTRVQSLFVLALFPVTALKLGVYNYMAAHMFSDLAGTKTHKSFVIPFMIIPFVACMIPAMQKTSNLEVINSDHLLPFVIIPFILILPVFMLIVYLIRRKKINLAVMSGPPEEDASK
jgi:spore germination protein KB